LYTDRQRQIYRQTKTDIQTDKDRYTDIQRQIYRQTKKVRLMYRQTDTQIDIE
jgi:hypothetical protein